jgi:hypothetical protein
MLTEKDELVEIGAEPQQSSCRFVYIQNNYMGRGIELVSFFNTVFQKWE